MMQSIPVLSTETPETSFKPETFGDQHSTTKSPQEKKIQNGHLHSHSNSSSSNNSSNSSNLPPQIINTNARNPMATVEHKSASISRGKQLASNGNQENMTKNRVPDVVSTSLLPVPVNGSSNHINNTVNSSHSDSMMSSSVSSYNVDSESSDDVDWTDNSFDTNPVTPAPGDSISQSAQNHVSSIANGSITNGRKGESIDKTGEVGRGRQPKTKASPLTSSGERIQEKSNGEVISDKLTYESVLNVLNGTADRQGVLSMLSGELNNNANRSCRRSNSPGDKTPKTFTDAKLSQTAQQQQGNQDGLKLKKSNCVKMEKLMNGNAKHQQKLGSDQRHHHRHHHHRHHHHRQQQQQKQSLEQDPQAPSASVPYANSVPAPALYSEFIPKHSSQDNLLKEVSKLETETTNEDLLQGSNFNLDSSSTDNSNNNSQNSSIIANNSNNKKNDQRQKRNRYHDIVDDGDDDEDNDNDGYRRSPLYHRYRVDASHVALRETDDRLNRMICMVYCVVTVAVVIGLIVLLYQYTDVSADQQKEKLANADLGLKNDGNIPDKQEVLNTMYRRKIADVIQGVSEDYNNFLRDLQLSTQHSELSPGQISKQFHALQEERRKNMPPECPTSPPKFRKYFFSSDVQYL